MMSPIRRTGGGRKVPPNVERRLWAESIGHCMNPSCQIDLIDDGVSVAEMAHIEAYAAGGQPSFENLILLCRNCHKQVDSIPPLVTTGELRAWKAQRNGQIEQRFAVKFSSFDNLQEAVTPLLQRNGQIFRDYGPDTDSPDVRALWQQFEGEIIANNRRIEIMLTNNRGLLHMENQRTVDTFSAHAREFVETRQEQPSIRVNLFPNELLSIFGLKEIETGLVPNVSALQNFITCLIDEGKFIDCELVDEQVVKYKEDGQLRIVNLKNRPMVQQLFWNRGFYKPATTKLRLEILVFFVQWLSTNKIEWKFNDIRSISELTVAGYQVKLLYEYQVSLAAIQAIPVEQGLLVVNLYNWNNGPFTPDAVKYAAGVNMRTFSQNEFFAFAHRNLK